MTGHVTGIHLNPLVDPLRSLCRELRYGMPSQASQLRCVDAINAMPHQIRSSAVLRSRSTGIIPLASDERIGRVTDRNPQSETPEEAAAEDGMWRHLEDDEAPTPQITESQSKRLKTPMIGMIITMAVLSLILAGLWFINPEPDVEYSRDEDVAESALWADDTTDYHPVAPEVPDEWSANYARWETRAEHSVDVWEAGYTTEAVDFFGFAQTDNANPAWVNEETNQAPAEGTTTINGLEFEVRAADERRYYVLEAEDNDVDGTTVVITTDTSEEEFDLGAEALVDALDQEPEADGDAEVEDPADNDDAVEDYGTVEEDGALDEGAVTDGAAEDSTE